MSRPYELMVILDSKVADSDAEGVVTRVSDLITQDGQLHEVNRWGRRKLAYEINKNQEGNYVVFEFSAGPEAVAEIDRVLSIADPVIRHKVVRLPERIAARMRTAGSNSNEQ